MSNMCAYRCGHPCLVFASAWISSALRHIQSNNPPTRLKNNVHTQLCTIDTARKKKTETTHYRSSKAGHIMHLFNTLLVPQTNRSPTERTTNTPPTKIPCIRTKIFSLSVKIVGIYDGVSYNKAMQIKWAKPLWDSLSNTMCRFLCVFSWNCFVAWITTRVTLLSFTETEKFNSKKSISNNRTSKRKWIVVCLCLHFFTSVSCVSFGYKKNIIKIPLKKIFMNPKYAWFPFCIVFQIYLPLWIGWINCDFIQKKSNDSFIHLFIRWFVGSM